MNSPLDPIRPFLIELFTLRNENDRKIRGFDDKMFGLHRTVPTLHHNHGGFRNIKHLPVHDRSAKLGLSRLDAFEIV